MPGTVVPRMGTPRPAQKGKGIMTQQGSFTALAAAAITVAAALTPGPAAARPSTLAAAHHRGASSQVVLTGSGPPSAPSTPRQPAPSRWGRSTWASPRWPCTTPCVGSLARGTRPRRGRGGGRPRQVRGVLPGLAGQPRRRPRHGLAGVPTGLARVRGVAIGAATADRLIASRVDDGRGDTTIRRLPTWCSRLCNLGDRDAVWLGFVKPLGRATSSTSRPDRAALCPLPTRPTTTRSVGLRQLRPSARRDE